MVRSSRVKLGHCRRKLKSGCDPWNPVTRDIVANLNSRSKTNRLHSVILGCTLQAVCREAIPPSCPRDAPNNSQERWVDALAADVSP